MAQPRERTAAPAPSPHRASRSISELPIGCVFLPDARWLLDRYLVPRALNGRVSEEAMRDAVAEGVNVYGARPAALPFPRRNLDQYGRVWGYFFATRPAAAAGGGGSGAAGGGGSHGARGAAAPRGCWRRYGGEKGYAGDDGEVYALRRTFAFHERGKRTVWRMKEFRLNEAAPAFRGVVFHPGAKGLVIVRVYNEVIPDEEPPVDYYNSDDEKSGAVVITVRDAIKAPACPAA